MDPAKSKCCDGSKMSVELWQNQHWMMTHGKWKPSNAGHSSWTDHTGVELSSEPTKVPPARLQLPDNWSSNPAANSKEVELLTVTTPGPWQFASSWDSEHWSTEQRWHSFVRQRKWVVEVAMEEPTPALNKVQTEQEAGDMPQTSLHRVTPELNCAAKQPVILSSPWSAVFANVLQTTASTPNSQVASLNHFVGLTDTIRQDSETCLKLP